MLLNTDLMTLGGRANSFLVLGRIKYTVGIWFFFLVNVYVDYFYINYCSYIRTGNSMFLPFFSFNMGVTRFSPSNLMHIPDMDEL